MIVIPSKENTPRQPVWPRVRSNIAWVCRHADNMLVSTGLKVKAKFKAKLFPSRLSGNDRFLLSSDKNSHFQSYTHVLTEQKVLANSLTNGEEAKNALILGKLPFIDAQIIAIKKLDNLQQADEVFASGVIRHQHSLITLQVRYQELGGKLDRSK